MRSRFSIIAYYSFWLAILWLFMLAIIEARYTSRRGIWFPGDSLPAPSGASTPLATTVELTQYTSDEALDAALDAAEKMGIGWLRQELPWDQIEPTESNYDWRAWDRVIEAASERGFRLVLVLNRTPEWARQPEEIGNPLAPPLERIDFALFAHVAAERYGDKVYGWQVWDQPNLIPHWGTHVALDPNQYAAFLELVTPAIRAGDPDAVVATAGLAPTSETKGFNMSEVLFLQGLYEAKADEYFDVVALKPYGFWTGPSGKLYDENVLNFERAVMVRDIMIFNDDIQTPVWLVEGGWAALPDDWQGDPPPWGSDSGTLQAQRLKTAIKRATLEWRWVEMIGFQMLQPDVPPTNPWRGLALLDEEGQFTALGKATGEMGRLFFHGPLGARELAHWEDAERPALLVYDRAIWVLLGFMGLLATGLLWHGGIVWSCWWGPTFRRQPEWLQVGVLIAVTWLFYAVGNAFTSIYLYAFLCLLISWRLDLGLIGVAFALPFFLLTKWFALLQFSMVELLLLPCAVTWLVGGLFTGYCTEERIGKYSSLSARLITLYERAKAMFWPQDALDWAILCLGIWGAISVSLADNSYVAAREFRVVLGEAVVWFWLVRRSGLTAHTRQWLVDALVASATLVAIWGLYQWFFTGDIITAEGVRRIKGVYGSPNNLALMLERVIPIVGAILLLAPTSRRRKFYMVALVPLVICLFLTFSRGAWLLGMPVALLWLGWWGGERARKWTLRLGVMGLLALIPFAATERITSAVDLDGGTWFIRFRLWESTLTMLQDYPLFGVGLDNFLYVYDAYRLPEAWREPDLSHPHQLFLHFWAALGLPGLALLLWHQGAFWRKWHQLSRLLPRNTTSWAMLVGLGASMAAALAHGLIDNAFFLVDLAFIWMLTLALVGEELRASRNLTGVQNPSG